MGEWGGDTYNEARWRQRLRRCQQLGCRWLAVGDKKPAPARPPDPSGFAAPRQLTGSYSYLLCRLPPLCLVFAATTAIQCIITIIIIIIISANSTSRWVVEPD